MAFDLEITVVARSSCDKFIQEETGLKLKTTAPPVDGQANRHIVSLLSKMFSCPQSSIELIQGLKSKKKIFRFHQLTVEEGQEHLKNIEKQVKRKK